jgi:hypothetical protein
MHSLQTKLGCFFCLLFTIGILQKGLSQKDTFFIPTKNDSLFFSAEYKQIEDRYKKNLDAISGDYKKELKEIYKERFENIKSNFTQKRLFTNSQVENYLKQLVNEIISNNAELQALPINIFFAKTEVPNAEYIGENTIIFHTGLFHRLQNESQVVFTLCHELSHFYLNHLNSHIEKYITTINSKEFQKELKSIKRAEYNQKAKLEKLALGLTFDSRKHSRYKESEADSMAIVLMSRTKFDNTEAVNLLGLLDTLDKEHFDAEKCLRNIFNSKEYPFKNSWVEKEEGLLGGHAKIKEDEKLADSLKTHPDCKSRIDIVKKLLEKYKQNTAQKSFINPTLFNALNEQLQLENIAYYMEKKSYSTAFYYCLRYLEKTPHNPFVITTIGNLFNEFYDAQKKHRLGSVTSMPNPDNDASFNSVLQFIQNLNLDDFKPICYNFLKSREAEYSKYPEFSKALNEAKKN